MTIPILVLIVNGKSSKLWVKIMLKPKMLELKTKEINNSSWYKNLFLMLYLSLFFPPNTLLPFLSNIFLKTHFLTFIFFTNWYSSNFFFFKIKVNYNVYIYIKKRDMLNKVRLLFFFEKKKYISTHLWKDWIEVCSIRTN